MNKVILMGRLTRDPETRYSSGANATAVCRYSIAVNRSYKREGEPDADFINIIAFGNRGEFANKYFRKGMMVAVVGEMRTGSYTDKNGVKRYTTDVVVTEQHFAEGKNSNPADTSAQPRQSDFAPPENHNRAPQSRTYSKPSNSIDDGFVPIPADMDGNDDLPF